jgi:hypothetical protein
MRKLAFAVIAAAVVAGFIACNPSSTPDDPDSGDDSTDDASAHDTGSSTTTDGGTNTDGSTPIGDAGAVPCVIHLSGSLSDTIPCIVGASIGNQDKFIFGFEAVDAASSDSLYFLNESGDGSVGMMHTGTYDQNSFDLSVVEVFSPTTGVNADWAEHAPGDPATGSLSIVVSSVSPPDVEADGTLWTVHGSVTAVLPADTAGGSAATGIVNLDGTF